MFAERTNWDLGHNRLSEARDNHRAAGKRLLDLTISNPTECGFRYDGEKILAALGNPAALHYEPDPRGLEWARRAVATYYGGYYRVREEKINLSDIFLTISTSEAYSFVFRMLCNPGDEILIPEPGYPLFSFLADIQDVKAARYPLAYDPDDGWRIDFRALEEAITSRTRGVIVVHPNNPTGHFTKAREVERLNEICAAHQLALIADEVFLDFSLGDERPRSFAANSAALTFTMSGLSKIAGLPQMKAAWVVVSGPESLKQKALERLEVIADTYLSANAPVQHAMPVLLEQRRDFQRQVMARVGNNLAEMDGQLERQDSCGRLQIEGGWYAVLRVPATRPDEDVAIELLTTKGVYVHPGHFYDFPSDGYLVVSLITPEADFGEGMRRLLSVF
jgi:aspartate/methionine/tyrosine aminotransferase